MREGGREGRIRTEASSFSFMCIISFIHSFTYDHSIIIIYNIINNIIYSPSIPV